MPYPAVSLRPPLARPAWDRRTWMYTALKEAATRVSPEAMHGMLDVAVHSSDAAEPIATRAARMSELKVSTHGEVHFVIHLLAKIRPVCWRAQIQPLY